VLLDTVNRKKTTFMKVKHSSHLVTKCKKKKKVHKSKLNSEHTTIYTNLPVQIYPLHIQLTFKLYEYPSASFLFTSLCTTVLIEKTTEYHHCFSYNSSPYIVDYIYLAASNGHTLGPKIFILYHRFYIAICWASKVFL
jgi:hypothetical protein